MSSVAEGKLAEEKSSGKLSKGDDAEEDVPDDFFDDFSNNDFMAGLDVVDAWEDGLNIGPNQDKDDAKEDVEKVPFHDAGVQKAESVKVIDKSEIKDSDRPKEIKSCLQSNTDDTKQKVSATDSNRPNKIESVKATTDISKSTSDNIKSIDSTENTDNSSEDPEVSSNASSDSDVKNLISPKLDLKDIKLNSECKVILESDFKSLAKEKITELSISIKNESVVTLNKTKNCNKETRKEAANKEIVIGPKELIHIKDGNSKESSVKDTKIDSKRLKSVGDQRRNYNIPRDSRISSESSDNSINRRDPDKTRRDIQRNKDRTCKEINAKYLDQKLRLVETGLLPPGTEMDDMDFNKEQDDGKIGDFRNKLRGVDRKDRDHSNRSNSCDRGANQQSLSTKRRHGDQNTSSHSSKRSKDKLNNTSGENVSLSPSPDRQIRNISSANLLERRGRYSFIVGDYEQHSPDGRPPLSPLRDREHSGSSSRRTLTIAEDMVRSLAANDGGIRSSAVMGKGDRIPRRLSGRSRSRSRSYEKYRAYKRSPSPTMKGYGATGGRGMGMPDNGCSNKMERSRSPKRDRRERDYKGRDRDRRSPREIELTQGRDRRERSSSPNQRKKAPTFLEELNEKLSKQQSSNPSNERRTFLEEIREKINRTNSNPQPMFPQQQQQIQFHSMPMAIAPAPAPVPPPQQFHQQIPPNPIVYDQNFFIGDTITPAVAQQHVLSNAMPHVGQQTFRLAEQRASGQMMQQTSAQMMQTSLIAISMAPMPEQSLQYHQQHQQQQQKFDKESIAKLFNDKQITLTDFLSITSKVAGSDRPVDLADKINVISRCQDAVKVMSNDSKLTGRFFMRKSHAQHSPNSPVDQPNLSDNKFISPLKRSPAVRFRFTSKAQVNDDMVNRTSVQLLLHNLGLPDGTEPIRDPTPEPEDLKLQHQKPVIVQEANNLKSIVPTDPIIIAPPKKEVLQKMCQTDPVNLCRECNVRSKKMFVSVGCQYDPKMFVSVSTQVNGREDTFTPARANLQGLLKSRSLASLTPAQILAQVATTTKVTPTNKAMDAPLKDDLPLTSPELKRTRMDLSSNQWNQSSMDGRDYDRSMMMTSNRQTDERDRDYDKAILTRRLDNRDMFNYNEQQQERHLQQQLQMTMEMQQKNRLMHMNTRDMNRFPSANNSGTSGNNPGGMNVSFAGNNPGGHFGGSNPGFNSGNQYGPNNPSNQNFGGNRFYN